MTLDRPRNADAEFQPRSAVAVVLLQRAQAADLYHLPAEESTKDDVKIGTEAT